jgi:hypothetical protein
LTTPNPKNSTPYNTRNAIGPQGRVGSNPTLSAKSPVNKRVCWTFSFSSQSRFFSLKNDQKCCYFNILARRVAHEMPMYQGFQSTLRFLQEQRLPVRHLCSGIDANEKRGRPAEKLDESATLGSSPPPIRSGTVFNSCGFLSSF